MVTKKGLVTMPRRVWRMTTDAPQGEYLELVPKEIPIRTVEAPERRSEADRPTVSAGPLSPETVAPQTKPSATGGAQAAGISQPPPRLDRLADAQVPAATRMRVLRPAQVESWQASSFDLFTGCTVRDVTETIPGEVFDELFKPDPSGAVPAAHRRRR